MAAIFKLSWLMDDNRRVRINWRDMATEELGSVYEGLLELVPTREEHGRTFAFTGGAEAKGNARKISGSYYTPDSLVQALLDSALDPVLDRAEAEGGAEAILALNVLDPACGSGHFLLGAARRMATRVAQLRDNDAPDYPAAMRDVARNCIHGVDRNPMAVELAKVALWIETVEPGKPLGFLDANIQCGDSLLGVFDLKVLEEGIPDDAYKALTGDDKETAKSFVRRNKAEKTGQGSFDWAGGGGSLPPAKLAADMDNLRHLPEDTVEQVEDKRKRFAAWASDPKRWAIKVACDLYTAAFLLPKNGGVPTNANNVTIPTTAHVRTRLCGGSLYGLLEAAAIDAATYSRAFHWPLAFPEVMIGRGGFDVVLGNPPWEVVQLSEEEYFATRDPAVAALAGAARKKAIAKLETEHPEMFSKFQQDKRASEAANEFARESGRFQLTARGKVNTYALFAEHFLNLSSPTGQAGLIVPAGIATDATTAAFFGHLIDTNALRSLMAFENEEFIFPGVHHSTRFCLLTLGRSLSRQPEFIFFARSVEDLREPRRRFTLSPGEIARINPNTKTAPVFRSQADAELTAKIYARVPVLIEDGNGEKGNPWSVEFSQGLFNMTSDSHLFRTAAQLVEEGYIRHGRDWVRERGARPAQDTMDLVGGRDVDHLDLSIGAALPPERYVPLYEAKMVSFFDHRASSYSDRGNDRGFRILPPTSFDEHNDPNYEIEPFYWAPQSMVKELLEDRNWNRGWLLGWKDITSSTSERTLIASPIPLSACGNTLFLAFPSVKVEFAGAVLSANWSALVQDFATRQKISGLHLNYNAFKQLPVLPPSAYADRDLAFIIPKVLELTYTSHAIAPFARDLGYDGPPFAWDDDRRAQLRADLDAWYALAYGLSRDELRYVLDPKEVMGADYPSETFRVLQKNEIAKYGEYRTARLVLAAYDRSVSEAMRPRTTGYR
jgi:Eco57I restriction-modification methylase